MRRRAAKLAIALAVASSLAACASPGDGRRYRGLRPAANPSAVVATELAFARAAQEKGQWAAFRQFAADDAVMFVPQPVKAKDWLKGRAEPAVAVKWQPYEVWMSCDGSLAVTKGAWQRPKGVGYFTTVWRRQKNGDYKWVLDQGDALKEPLPEPEMIAGQVADCGGRAIRDAAAADFEANLDASDFSEGAGVASELHESDDGTLIYTYAVEPNGARKFRVGLLQDGEFRPVLRSDVAAE